MNITDKASFIEAFKNEFSAQIEEVSEVREDGYLIQLNEGEDKHNFANRIMPFMNQNNDFEDSFDLIINSNGDDYSTDGLVLSVNGDYDDDDERGMISEEDMDPIEPFEVEVNGEAYTIIPQGQGSEYLVQKGDEKLGVIEPEFIDDDLKWVSTDLIDPDLVEKIGEAIEDHDL